MKNYYLHNGKQQLGPFSLEQLKDKQLSNDTPVWSNDLPDWTKAGEVPELQELLINNTPPPFSTSVPPIQKISKSEKAGFRIGKFLGWTGIIIVVIAISAFFINRNSSSTSGLGSSGNSLLKEITQREKTPEELRAELAQKEKSSPTEYLVPTVTVRGNFIGQTIVEGSVMNNASIAVFKDIVLEVTYRSKTGTALSSERFTIYEIAAPGKWASFKFKTSSPSDTKAYTANVISAVPTE